MIHYRVSINDKKNYQVVLLNGQWNEKQGAIRDAGWIADHLESDIIFVTRWENGFGGRAEVYKKIGEDWIFCPNYWL